MSIDEMIKILIQYSDVDTALDIINLFKKNENVNLIWKDCKLILK